MKRHITVMVLALLSTLLITCSPAWSLYQTWHIGYLEVKGDPDFGTVEFNSIPPAHQFTLTNSFFIMQSYSLNMMGSQFRMTSLCESFFHQLAAGESCTVIVEPNTSLAGYLSENLVIGLGGDVLKVVPWHGQATFLADGIRLLTAAAPSTPWVPRLRLPRI